MRRDLRNEEARKQVLVRSCGRCECTDLDHRHDRPHGRPIGARPRFAWKDDCLQDNSDPNTFMAICWECYLQNISLDSRIT
jgi:hypothetical protein